MLVEQEPNRILAQELIKGVSLLQQWLIENESLTLKTNKMEYKIFAGIDQSKLTINVALLNATKPGLLVSEKFENNPKGFKMMMKWIKKNSMCSMQEVLICSEHTGLYSYPLSVFC